MSLLLDKIDQIIVNNMKSNQIPGAAVHIIKDHKVLLSQGYGKTTAAEWGSAIRPDTLFRIASVSKLFTGTVLMMLVEKGLIDLDVPIQTYVPWFTTADQEKSKLITIRMLLTHSSGLPTGGELSFHYNESALFQYMKKVVPTLPILFHPGTAYSYGNHALNIAGFVATQVTKQSFAELMQEMLFDPLEMTQTTYQPLKAMTQPLAMPHDRDKNGKLTVAKQFLDDAASYPSYYAFSSIEDLSKFALMHLKDGTYKNKQLISFDSIKEMQSRQSKWYNLTDGGCGISFFQENKDGIKRYWHYGQYSHQYSSQFILIPEKGIAVIALANGEGIFQAGYEIVDELLKDEKMIHSEITSSYPEQDLSGFEGSYLHSYYGRFDFYQEDEKKYLRHADQAYELIRFNIDTYICRDEKGEIIFTVGFPNNALKENSQCMVINSKACPEFKYNYVVNPNDWKSFEGSYFDGLEFFEVSVQGDLLVIHDLQNDKESVANAISSNQFLTKEYGLISFIKVHGEMILEFDHAWRYRKQPTNA